MNNLNPQAQANCEQLASFKPHVQALIASTMMERMLPNYLLFSEVSGFGEPKALRDALNIVWEKQIVKNLKLNTQKQLEKIEPSIPDTEDFDMFGVYPALDTIMGLSCLLQGMGGDEEGFIDVCMLSLASVSKVAEIELSQDTSLTAEQLQQQLDQHELVQYELDFLSELVEQATPLNQLDKNIVNRFRARALADGITNIAIEVS